MGVGELVLVQELAAGIVRELFTRRQLLDPEYLNIDIIPNMEIFTEILN